MKKIIVIICIWAISIVGITVVWAVDKKTVGTKPSGEMLNIQQESKRIGKNFSDMALEKLRADLKPGIDTNAIKKAVQKFSVQIADILLIEETGLKTTEITMDQCALFYRDSLEAMLNGESPNDCAQVYADKAETLFKRINLRPMAQWQISCLINGHFVEVHSLLMPPDN